MPADGVFGLWFGAAKVEMERPIHDTHAYLPGASAPLVVRHDVKCDCGGGDTGA